jgi:putative membrane protein
MSRLLTGRGTAVHRRLTGRGARLAAVLTATALIGLGPGSALAVDSASGVRSVNTETVQTYLNADGKVDSSRLYEQLTVTGHGSVTLKNPVDTDGLRNLDGFGGLSPDNGVLQQHYDVDGVAQDRSVSTFDTDKLPLSVEVGYQLDGRAVSADDLVGATGDVDVTYTVKNLTTKKVPLTFTNGSGGTVTRTGKVPIPIVGTVVFDLPKNFSQVRSKAASMGGDGHGGTQMEYLLTLFPPIGSDTVSFGYSAHLTDGLLPPVSFTAVPVDPTTNPTFTAAVDSYQSGAKTGDKLAAGATKVNTNLLRLRDGAGQLLSGLIQLNDGAHQLDAGLSDQIAPGADQIASGSHQANVGGQKLAAGLSQLHNALATLPQTLRHNHKYQLLLGALTQIADGVGNLDDKPTVKSLLGGLNAIQQGLEVGSSNDCIKSAQGIEPKNCGAIDAVKTLALFVRLSTSQSHIGVFNGVPIYTQGDVVAAMNTIAANSDCAQTPACQAALSQVTTAFKPNGDFDKQMALLLSSLTEIATKADKQLLDPGAGLDQLRAGLSHGDAGDCIHTQCGIKEAALAVHAGVPLLVDSLRQQILAGLGAPGPGCDPTKTLRCGAAALADGLGQLDTGSHQLSDGLDTASSGSHQLADGLQQARDGAPALKDGANELSERGVVKIVQAGQDTAQQYGKLYATLVEGAKRAHTDGMVYGAPSGSMGLMAYDFEIDGSDGQGSRNVERLILAIVLGGLGLGAFALRRRSVPFLPAA